ncbi:MAG: hypothetical protein ACOYWZ_14535 [Bacillota bacterium]
MSCDKIVLITQGVNNKSIPYLISNATKEKVKCMENEIRVNRINEHLKNLPFIIVEEQKSNRNELLRVLEMTRKKEYILHIENVSSTLEIGGSLLEHPFIPDNVCNDTPFINGIFDQACEAAMAALYSGYKITYGSRTVYTVCRPPGHHAGKAWVGGYCYLNNAVIALKTILEGGIKPVGLLDIDFHFGNGSADILVDEPDTVFVSIHASTENNYPYTKVIEQNQRQMFIPFVDKPSESEYLDALDKAIDKIAEYGCKALVVSIGFDIIKGDPHGTWDLSTSVFKQVGVRLKKLGIPLCFIQEGGYLIDKLGECAYQLCCGLK